MKIKDLIGESYTKNSGHSMGLKTMIAPKTFGMLSNKYQYDKEVAAAKKNEPKKPVAPVEKITVYQLSIPLSHVEDWERDRDVALAFRRSRNWGMHGLPDDIAKEIMSDPNWQNIVIKLWDFAKIVLEVKRLPKSNRAHVTPFDRAGVDIKDVRDVYLDLMNLINSYLKKHNIDKHGRRLGNASHWAK